MDQVWPQPLTLRQTVRLPDAKGLRDLAVLLSRPGRDVHCTELMGAAVEQPDTGPMIDAQARRAYEARIIELQADLKEAEGFGDTDRACSVVTQRIRAVLRRLDALHPALARHLRAAVCTGAYWPDTPVRWITQEKGA
jgi:hypothetical protein